MAINISEESLLPILEAVGLFPGRPHVATLWRWISKGVRGVKLETIVSGGRRFTSHEAVNRFIAATTAVAQGSGQQPASGVVSARQREASIAQAEAELE